MSRQQAPAEKLTLAEIVALDAWMDIKLAAKYGSINRKVLERAARKKKVRAGRLGTAYRFRPSWINEFLLDGGFDGTHGGRA
jgi:hypothetical protein